jgi:hypothetical protein
MNGPGVGSGSSGASYGGVGGGSDDSIPYGSLFSPTDLGIIPSCLILIVGNEKFPSSETNMYVPLSRRAVCEVAAILTNPPSSTYRWWTPVIFPSIVEIIIHKFLGDRTGQLHLRSHQTAWIEYVESIKNVTEAPLSYIIDYGSEVIFPTEVHMQGINTTIEGKMENNNTRVSCYFNFIKFIVCCLINHNHCWYRNQVTNIIHMTIQMVNLEVCVVSSLHIF